MRNNNKNRSINSKTHFKNFTVYKLSTLAGNSISHINVQEWTRSQTRACLINLNLNLTGSKKKFLFLKILKSVIVCFLNVLFVVKFFTHHILFSINIVFFDYFFLQ